MTPLPHDRYCDEIGRQTDRLRAAVTSGAALTATVPTCPDWTLEDLARHVGRALRWSALLVRTRAEEDVPEDEAPGAGGPVTRGDAAALDAWLAESGETVVGALREAGPDGPAWSWSGIRTAGFWARRMTHELIVHAADAELAAGRPFGTVPADAAADAIEEWLEIVRYAQQVMSDPEANELRVPGAGIHLHATDAPAELNAEWLIELPDDGITWRRGHEKAAVALRGPLADVLLAFYRRLPLDAPGLEVLGDRKLLEFWLDRATFT
ncbi:maleylpyruvate isomerase family mycothiol-dependent enzyme [Streptomyces olivaceus]|uniref:maleylpyruvate isomerase family mycothiol-dependent enzyme n=1 Tax=Streptomyces TaxID=1883 RepID=UPI001CCD9806|nr:MULTISPECIES: maleylpyruvate isomerase family mycothiol-dependent enzyme [Streptomyces]MBZ6140314.1 maleylpyruvate isomerase family mycothiol-dependent enzyme [Streptomyces olivaceus]MBZ6167856.1 maleylpyruvate isomerase family mycothiol-dependent enzyme [Streptomyces olivaceus]UOG79257.1 maleylpyruvate isomerase family mycothiol-dependent enzyme [Streptomyces sp. CB09030]